MIATTFAVIWLSLLLKISSNELERTVRSAPFRRRLAEIATYTLTTGRESGFVVHRSTAKPAIRVTPPCYGTEDARLPLMDHYEEAVEEHGFDAGFPLLALHFHPNPPDEYLGISDEDLNVLLPAGLRQETRPIVGIGQVANDGTGYVGLAQSQFTWNGTNHATLFNDLLDRQEEVADAAMSPCGWDGASSFRKLVLPSYIRAAALDFSIPPSTSEARISDYSAIRDFAYATDAATSGWARTFERLRKGNEHYPMR